MFFRNLEKSEMKGLVEEEEKNKKIKRKKDKLGFIKNK